MRPPLTLGVLSILTIVTVVTSCGDDPPDTAAKAAAASPADATSTSRGRDDLCAHGVLDAICPQCHPALAAVFKAKGDWCAEHELPESVCPICHPERGGRPTREVGIDEAPADGTVINLRTAEAAAMAGIETTVATTRTSRAEVEALVRITYDATRLALVSAPTAGVVKRVCVDVGAPVKRGALLAVIASTGVSADRSQLSAAQARLKAAEANLLRERDLLDKGVSPQRDVERAQSERDAALAAVQGARAALGVVGAAETGAGTYTLHAPLGGVITRRMASIGQTLAAGGQVFEIVDASTMWADVEVPEAELARVRAGQDVRLHFDALGDRSFEGTIAFVAPVIDPRTRTTTARVPLENADGALRANLFGHARIRIDGDRPLVAVPRVSVQRAEGQAFVFVKTAPERFEARRVSVAQEVDDSALLTGGLKAGETIATTGAFLLKTEILKGAIGAGCCE